MGINIRRDELISPYFVIEGKNKNQGIKNFPGVFRFSIDRLLGELVEARSLGLKKILLFGIPREKDNQATQAYSDDNIIARAVRSIKKEFRDLTVITDVCLCAYTRHGHCGIVQGRGQRAGAQGGFIDYPKTLQALSRIALTHADAGADWVAPSAMAEKQVLAIRKALDRQGHSRTKIMGYSAKFASNFYGLFRRAADSAPKFGDRSSYQLDFHSSRAALKEIGRDIKEGADAVMVKPALSYLDIISRAKERFGQSAGAPLFVAYNVSGEYSFVKLGAKKGLWEEEKMVFEIVTAIKRAGADLVISYHAKDIARWLNGQK